MMRCAPASPSTAPTLDAALAELHLAGAPRKSESFSWAEQIARFATDPVVSGLLLTLGMLGLLIEMQTLHGIAGVIGIGALALFFGSHVYAGFSNGFVVVLAVLGLFGILGNSTSFRATVCQGYSVSPRSSWRCFGPSACRFFRRHRDGRDRNRLDRHRVYADGTRGAAERVGPRLALAAAQGPEYVASSDYRELRGCIGTAASYLRPAGIASIGGRRIDVLTEGEFIAQGTPIRVVRVEGARIFVEPVSG